MAKRQGAIVTSTYSAEFMALLTATEEVISLQYMTIHTYQEVFLVVRIMHSLEFL